MSTDPRYILLISTHGLIRGKDPELGRDADTGGQIKYVLELAQALGKHPDVERVDLMTRLIVDPQVSEDYSKPVEPLSDNVQIVRVKCGAEGYIPKEELWDYLDNFVDNALTYLKEQDRTPDIVHSHYADAGYVGTRLSNLLGIPQVHTGHSLGRIKRRRLLASGMNRTAIEDRYNMARRINAEEETLGNADLVVTSTHQEVNDQYVLYDYYQPSQMKVVPPGTDLEIFHAPTGDEWERPIFEQLTQFLREPKKPIILALSRLDQRKNTITLVEAYGESKVLQAAANLVFFVGTRGDIQDLPSSAQDILMDLLTAIDRYDLYGKIAYPKKLRSEDLPSAYRLAALSGGVFVNPALTEPFGLTLIEAAASALPIVATEDGGPTDIVKNCQNGYLIDPLDKADIVDKLLQVIKQPQTRETFAQQGLEGVHRHYSWSSHVEKYLEVLRPIAEKRESGEQRPLKRRSRLYNNGAIVTGIDQNLIGDSDALTEFLQLLRQHRQNISFCIATGRRLDSALKLLNHHKIPQPDVLITSIGTEIYYAPNLTRDTAWTTHIDHLWNPKALHRILSDLPGLALQDKTEQSAFKISYFYDPNVAPPVEEIRRLLHQNEKTVNVIFGFGQYLDVVPIRASKGYALRWFLEQRDIPLEHTLAVGGSGADEDLMRGNTLSVVVGNRHDEELSDLAEIEPIFFSEKKFAAGILDGIEHYDFFKRCEGE